MISRHTVSTGRAELHVEGLGDGTPVIFLHAAVADTRMWSNQMVGVASKAKAIAYDRRGFGRTRYEPEDYSSIADLIAVLDVLGDERAAVLVGCSQGARIALDATLEHPSRVSGLALIAPNVPGAPEPCNPPEIADLLAEQSEAINAHDIDRVNAIKAHLWLDGPLMTEGRVSGKPRDLLLDMNAIVLRAPPVGTDLDVSRIAPAFDRLGEIAIPSLMIWGDLDFPHVTERCCLVADRIANCSSLELAGSAHLPGLDRPGDVTSALCEFVGRCSD